MRADVARKRMGNGDRRRAWTAVCGEKVNVKANGGILLVAHAKPFVGGGARVSQSVPGVRDKPLVQHRYLGCRSCLGVFWVVLDSLGLGVLRQCVRGVRCV